MTRKAAVEWGLEQEKVLQQLQAAVQAAPPLGSPEPAGPTVPEVAESGAGQSLRQALEVN